MCAHTAVSAILLSDQTRECINEELLSDVWEDILIVHPATFVDNPYGCPTDEPTHEALVLGLAGNHTFLIRHQTN